MKTSATEPPADRLLVFLESAGAPDVWLRFADDGSVERGRAAEGLAGAGRHLSAILVAPGEEVAIHWLELPAELTPAQTAAAARLMLAEESAEPISALHVAVGRPEAGRVPAATVTHARLAEWLAQAAAAGIEPVALIPSPMLLDPPERGHVRYDRNGVADYRGTASAFSLEPELAEPLLGEGPIARLDDEAFLALLRRQTGPAPLDLLGFSPPHRRWQTDRGTRRRIAALAVLFGALTLAVQLATLVGLTFSADRMERETQALAAGGSNAGPVPFGAAAALLFDAVRATPNVEIGRLRYGEDGRLVATVYVDAPASLTALKDRVALHGLALEVGDVRTAGGRPAADVVVRAR